MNVLWLIPASCRCELDGVRGYAELAGDALGAGVRFGRYLTHERYCNLAVRFFDARQEDLVVVATV